MATYEFLILYLNVQRYSSPDFRKIYQRFSLFHETYIKNEKMLVRTKTILIKKK